MKHLSNRLNQLQVASSRGSFSFERRIGSFEKNHKAESTGLLISVLDLLKREGYIRFFTIQSSINSSGRSNSVTIYLKYNAQGVPAFRSIFLVSTPGRPIYASTQALWQPLSTSGIFVLSTIRGICTDQESRKFSLGGKLLFGIF